MAVIGRSSPVVGTPPIMALEGGKGAVWDTLVVLNKSVVGTEAAAAVAVGPPF